MLFEKKCPKCKSNNVVPIIYGKPGKEMMKNVKEGKIVLGGCIIKPFSKKWHCKECKNKW